MTSKSPQFRMIGPAGIAWLGLLMLVVPGALTGCASLFPAPADSADPPLLFPPPPAPARIQYLCSVSSPQDLPQTQSKLAEFVLGPKPLMYPLVKPNNAELWESRLYVGDTVMNSVLVYDLETGEAGPLAGDRGNGKIQQPNNLSVDLEKGRLYVADKLRGAVLMYDAQGQFIDAWGRPEACQPVDVEAAGRYLYVCDILEHQLELWDRETGELVRAIGSQGSNPGQFYYPTHLAVGPEGSVYVTDTFNARVQKFSAEGEFIASFGGRGTRLGQFSWPKGIDVDSAGRIYVVDSRFANVQIFNPDHQLLLFFGGPGPSRGNLDLPSGLTTLPWPDLPMFNQRLVEGFTPESLVIVVSQKGGGYVNFFAVAGDEEG